MKWYSKFTAIARNAMEAWYEEYCNDKFKLCSMQVIKCGNSYIAISEEIDWTGKRIHVVYDFDYDYLRLDYIAII